ncbi:PE-PGRS family protein PE_PGRS5-like isoform X1 [Eurosta solidaginis]|uniref:PE-PGRS family protein PE_PGRS5-like isoform X1 n=1 Tax=Eurosta solidaginis TaxID=178769 RepID=UPI003530ECC5
MRLLTLLNVITFYFALSYGNSNKGSVDASNEILTEDMTLESNNGNADDISETFGETKSVAKVGAKFQGDIGGGAEISSPLGDAGIKGGLSGIATGKAGANGSSAGGAANAEFGAALVGNIGGDNGITCGIQGNIQSSGDIGIKETGGNADIDVKLNGGLGCSIGGHNIAIEGNSNIGGLVGVGLEGAANTLGKVRHDVQSKLKSPIGLANAIQSQ